MRCPSLCARRRQQGCSSGSQGHREGGQSRLASPFTPLIQSWNECNTAIYTEVSKMLAGQKTPEQAMKTAKRYFDEAQARVKNLASRRSGVA
jgi:hypothetical protein